MRSALELSKYIISKCNNEDCPISNLQLQKILYYIQGAFYRTFNKPAFDDDIEAWQHGPVVKNVYYEYSNYVASKLTMNILNNVINEYDNSEIKVINEIIEKLKAKDAWELVDMTHREDPWKLVSSYFGIISKESIKNWFNEHGEVVC